MRGYLIQNHKGWFVTYWDTTQDSGITVPIHPNHEKYCDEKYGAVCVDMNGVDVNFKIIKDSLVEYDPNEAYNSEFAVIAKETKWSEIYSTVAHNNGDDVGSLGEIFQWLEKNYLPPIEKI